MQPHAISGSGTRALLRAAFVLGIALGGFFDGILLHQVLQWHHLLSLVPGESLRDPRAQILADGMFHVLMYVIAAVGLWMLWRARGVADEAGSGRAALGGLVLGYGAWNVIDVVLFHWILHIHRIRLDTESPLAYDVGWLLAFGLVPLVIGWFVLKGRPGAGRGAAATMAAIAVAVGGAGLWSLRPSDNAFTTVLFSPATDPAEVVAAIAAVDGRLVAADASGQLVVLQLADSADRWRLYRHGALVVGGAGAAACAAWSVPDDRVA